MDLWAFGFFAVSSLFAVVDPLGCIPFFSGQTAGMSQARKRRVLLKALLLSLCMLLAFTLFGQSILHLFGITVDAFRVAGGVIFFGIGLDMMQSQPRRWRTGLRRAYVADHPELQAGRMLTAEGDGGDELEGEGGEELEGAKEPGEDPSITPLAIPMLAGPGSITTVMVLRAKAEGHYGLLVVIGALFTILVLTGIILWGADRVLIRIGQTGMRIIEKLMGLLVVVIAVQLVMDGLESYLKLVNGV
ncbi:MAG: antibiotic resistance protein MarC [Planctomycetota bacterium]|nr:MAG: antibiotic resistance protein MarC [Planctomycetota bacterium]